jgi:aromatic-amino-acid transaminase
MQEFFMTAGAAQGKRFVDPVFSVLGAAREAIAKYGKDQVVNASIGTIYDDEEKLAYFPAVSELIKSLPPEQVVDYAPIGGIAGFDQAVLDFAFGKSKPDSYLAAIATPGGTGAIRNVFYNYADAGTKILLPDWLWGAYNLIAGEYGRLVDNYQLFTEKHTYNLPSVQAKVKECLREQDNLVVVFNTPAHNPTGFSLSKNEWEATLSFFKEEAKDSSKRIILLIDVAYMDYAGEPEEIREFFSLLTQLPENLLVTIAFSMSKSFLVYGLRCGALIGVSSSQRVIDEFMAVNAYSTRSNWSNVTTLPQRIMVQVAGDAALMEGYFFINAVLIKYFSCLFQLKHGTTLLSPTIAF